MTGVAGDVGTVSNSRTVTDSRSLLGSPRDVAIGVAAGSFWFSPVCFGFPVVNTGGGGRLSQLRPRNATTS